MKRKRLTMVERYTYADVVMITRMVAGKRRTTVHYDVTSTSYTRLRMVILSMVARGDGHIVVMVLPPTPAYGWIYYPHA